MWFPFFKKKQTAVYKQEQNRVHVRPDTPSPKRPLDHPSSEFDTNVRRHFYNERGFQTYGSFFEYWDGVITAGHVMSDTNDRLPPFAMGPLISWPDGLDAALLGCRMPASAPQRPQIGQEILCLGYPAGSAHMAKRHARVYLQRPNAPDTWIAHILEPDEPVVTGMSGGPVIDKGTGTPIGIIITRNSPADLNNDRDPDESLDFVSLAGVWQAVKSSRPFV